MNLFFVNRFIGFAANAAVKSLGTALIVLGTTRFGAQHAKNPINSQNEAKSIQASLNTDDSNRILKGNSIHTAMLPLRQTTPVEIDQILIEAANIQSSEPDYNISEAVSSTGQNIVHYFGKLMTDFFFNKKRLKLSDAEIMESVNGRTPGLTIEVQSANEVYKQGPDQEKVLSLHFSMKNAARIGFILRGIKFFLYGLLILKLWDCFLFLLRRIVRKNKQVDSIDVDYKIVSNQNELKNTIDSLDVELMNKRKIYLNPANYFNQKLNK